MKIDRLLSLVNLLTENDRMTAKGLAERLEVSKRTIYRDIETLNLAGIPVISYSGIRGGYGIVEGYKVSKHIFSTEDISTIMTGLSAIQSISESVEISPLLAKIAPNTTLQQPQSDLLIDLSSWYKPNDSKNKIDDLRQAIAMQQIVVIQYHSKKGYSEREIEPYKLIFKASHWYLYGFCLKRKAFRLFKLTRIQTYTMLDERFESRALDTVALTMESENEDLEAMVLPEMQQIILTYKQKDKLYLIDKLGAEFFQEHEKEATGTIVFPLLNLKKSVDFILRLQDKVRVIEPPVLVNEVKEKIEEMYFLYKS
ncbi:hypothetical protein UAY_02823 [Enterococcus moraviensis ATCC BAA-383]|uniref:HTH deoR-type domain-containing protein n=1 Tax=Enterococcus moraviensis ATCC BAA-383 TaxID=1158609 RepID=R2SMU4_9ENTE|nr:YafY family protein [Enterococcus moraviensis]EOH96455.1 hypothetical protein UAY_02823 [Enterococcus moraviensis ATCC BAA-383]EOT65881.1 hypothetical protein I586_02150 [Enterococcus moraviensis ATCC BAA-383]OJG68349.1 hypothetical protein RV09_GL001596 [Enterococcus moraviensis]